MTPTAEKSPTRILIVDDNPEFLGGLKLTLEMENYIVDTAINGKDAIEKLQIAIESNASHIPDLILTDIMMPVMDGYEFYETVRANPYTNHIPVIFLTAKDSDADIRLGKELGSEDYLTKLASTDEILASIRGKLARIEQRRALLGQVAKAGQNTNASIHRRRNLVIMITAFVILLAVFGWGLASIIGLV